MVKKIIHIADLHIRTIQMHDLYKEQFEKLLKDKNTLAQEILNSHIVFGNNNIVDIFLRYCKNEL